MPGLWIESGTGSDSVYISSRGSNLDSIDYDVNGIKLLQDGLPVSAADGSNHNRIFDPKTARYLSFSRGANALRYGASQIGGALDIVSKTGRTQPRLELNSDAGSFGLLSNRLTLAGSNENFDGLVSIEGKTREGYRTHNQQRRKSADANTGWQIHPDVYWQVFLTEIDNQQQLAGSLTEAVFLKHQALLA